MMHEKLLNIKEEESKKQILNNEILFLETQNLIYQLHYDIIDYEIQWQQNCYYIHTFVMKSDQQETIKKKQTLLLLPGNFGLHMIYAKMYKELNQSFNIYSIDLPGMGQSSKQQIQINSRDQAIEFYLGTLKKLINLLFDKQKISIAGYQLGGYLASQLLATCIENIENVFLLSPIGLTFYTKDQIQQIQSTNMEGFFKKSMSSQYKKLWDNQSTLQQLSKNWVGLYLIRDYLKNILQLNEQEFKLAKVYINDVVNLPIGSEKSIYNMFLFPNYISLGEYSIEYLLKSKWINNIPIFIYLGDNENTLNKGAYKLKMDENFKNIQIRYLSNTQYPFLVKNSSEVAKQIIEDSRLLI